MSINKEDCLRVGTYVNTHGIKGEVKVYPHTDDVTRFEGLDFIYLDSGKEMLRFDIQNVRYFKNMAIIKFKGINDINDIEKYKGKDLYVTREQAVPLEENEYFICDIIGAKVITDDGVLLGELYDVLQTGANDVYVVRDENKKEVLLPVIPSCILDVNIEEKIVKAHIMPGLLDL